MSTRLNSIVIQMMAIFSRYREMGIPGVYLFMKGRFKPIGSSGYGIHRKADNDNAAASH